LYFIKRRTTIAAAQRLDEYKLEEPRCLSSLAMQPKAAADVSLQGRYGQINQP